MIVHILKPLTSNIVSRHLGDTRKVPVPMWSGVDCRDHPEVFNWCLTYYRILYGPDVIRPYPFCISLGERPPGLRLSAVMAGRPILVYSTDTSPYEGIQFYSVITQEMDPIWSNLYR